MSAREDAIEAGAQALHGDECPDDEHDLCDVGAWDRAAAAVVEAVEPIIRADERERILSELEGPARESEAMYAHAEAVAARLVEVICRMDEEAEWYTPGSLEQARHQRDAARAEVAALRERPGVFDVVRGSCGHKWLAEHTGLDWCPVCTDVDYKVKAKLADLRAKVEGLPYRTWVPPHATDCPGRPGKRGICTCGDSLRASDWMLRADVLALLEEVGK